MLHDYLHPCKHKTDSPFQINRIAKVTIDYISPSQLCLNQSPAAHLNCTLTFWDRNHILDHSSNV